MNDLARSQVVNMSDYRHDRHQVENGHVRIANGVIDDLMLAPLTSRQFKVALAVLRKTYGYSKKSDRIPVNQIATMTGLPRQKASSALNELIAYRVISRDGQRGELAYNKRSETWDFTRKPAPKAPKTSVTKTVTVEPECHQKGFTECHQNGNLNRQTDKSTTSEANASDASAASAKPKKPKAPECPFEQLIGLYREHFPDKPQPQTLGERRKRILRQGWMYAMRTPHRKTGKPLYTDTAGGIEWWARFMEWVRDNAVFCMTRQHNFSINWLFTPKAIENLMDGEYNEIRSNDR